MSRNEYARVDNGTVVERLSIPASTDLAATFSADFLKSLIPCDKTVVIGDINADGAFTSAPPPTVDLRAYIAAKRYAIETGSIVVNGQVIVTDRESQALINGAYNYLSASGLPTIRFKAANGFITLTAEALTAVALAVGAHVQSCFDVESELLDAITAGNITTSAEIDAANWPPNSSQ